MPLVEDITPGARKARPKAPAASPASDPSRADDPSPEGMPAEMAEAAAAMEAWRQSDPAGFDALMAATVASKAAGDDPATSMRKLESLLAGQQASQRAAEVATGGIELPGGGAAPKKKVGLDGKVVEDVAGVDIEPVPGFVVKTKRLDPTVSEIASQSPSRVTGATDCLVVGEIREPLLVAVAGRDVATSVTGLRRDEGVPEPVLARGAGRAAP